MFAKKIMTVLEQMTEHLQRQIESGVSIKSYCQQVGLKEHVFYYWRSKLKTSVADPTTGFRQLGAVTNPPLGSVTMVLPNGVQLSFSERPDIHFLKLLLA